MISIKQFLWVLPFASFLGGYFLLYCFFTTKVLSTPALIGKSLQEAVQILSDNNLNVRIISQKEDADLCPGTIISQTPTPHRTIRPHQSIFIVISKKTLQKTSPLLVQKNSNECLKIAQDQGISLKFYYLQSIYQEGTCIGQLPAAHQPLHDKNVIVYLAKDSSTKPVLLPNFKKLPLQEVTNFLAAYNIKFITIHARPIEPDHVCKNCVIIDQKPLAGSLIDLKKPLTLQLYVQ